MSDDDAGKGGGGTAKSGCASAALYSCSVSYTSECPSRRLGEPECLESTYGEDGDESSPWEDSVGESGGNEMFWLALDLLRNLRIHQPRYGVSREPSSERMVAKCCA